MSTIPDGGAGAFPQVQVQVPMDEFENAIRKIGVVAACEWFGHAPGSQFTKDTIEHFRARGEA